MAALIATCRSRRRENIRGPTDRQQRDQKMRQIKAGLFNDSFPPIMDGVSNVVVNYANIINANYGAALVATPYQPRVQDNYPFEVVRYPSIYLGKDLDYRMGFPYNLKITQRLKDSSLDIIHCHCPLISAVLARRLRRYSHTPVVVTYHTKFDQELESALPAPAMREAVIRLIVKNIEDCDEVWTVSEGAGQNLRSLGYLGDYIVMPNGVDFDRRPALPARTALLRAQLEVTADTTVFLFVGRMRWYKGLRLALDGLAKLKATGEDFCFVMVGDGLDRPEIEAYARQIGLAKQCIFTGRITERENLRDYYSAADMLLFPSNFDTNGLVVREAAACGLPGLLLRGSCAAEGIIDGRTGLLIDDDPEELAAVARFACQNKEILRRIGANAAELIYLSWGDAVNMAYKRYLNVIDSHDRKILPRIEKSKRHLVN